MPTMIEQLKGELQGNKGLVNLARGHYIPKGEELAKQAWRRVSFSGKKLNADDVKANFNSYLCELVDREYELYLEYEEQCINRGVLELALDPDVGARFRTVQKVVRDTISALQDSEGSDSERLARVASLLRPFYKLVEQSFAQGRMSRAGGSSQYHLKRLLETASYSGEFETQQTLNGEVDLLFPGLEAWKRDRRRCVLVSIKRSLRERYKQVFEELGITRGMTVYLLVTETDREARKDITQPKVKKLDQQNVYPVVRDEIKQKRFPKASNVISFTDFINQELPSRRAQWGPLLRRLRRT